jgi:hypothetical protein
VKQGVRLAIAERLVADGTLIGMPIDTLRDQLGPSSAGDQTMLCFGKWDCSWPLDVEVRRRLLVSVREGRCVEATIWR